jgi:hypothetical protein
MHVGCDSRVPLRFTRIALWQMTFGDTFFNRAPAQFSLKHACRRFAATAH